ncbi:MAG: alpha/beta fold hydrolase [Pseudomonadota bacterium]|nr:alpha/beta fold hydrolase [Pseudomonadota bacterium]
MKAEAQARLEKLWALHPEASPAFEQALAREAVARSRRFIKGVKAYQQSTVRRTAPFGPVIWQEGSTSLRDYNPRQTELPIVLVIPSLINRFEILDLDRQNSFLRALAAHGFRPLVVDWSEPGTAEMNFDVTSYVTRRLVPILEAITATGGPAVHMVGYCMGGLLALALASRCPQQTRTLTLMATPWDFHKPDPEIGPQYLALSDRIEPQLQAIGHLPVDFIQSLFAVFQPMQIVNKFTEAAAYPPHSPEARHFVLLEDWLNEGVPLTAPVARDALRGWYGENRTAEMEWSVAGERVDPRLIAKPVYVIAPDKDRIVPPESAKPLARLFPHATLHEPMMGHIGLVASRNAPQQVWAGLFKWLSTHN